MAADQEKVSNMKEERPHRKRQSIIYKQPKDTLEHKNEHIALFKKLLKHYQVLEIANTEELKHHVSDL